MTRLVAVMFIAAAVSISALAQQPASSVNKAEETASPAQRMRDAFLRLDSSAISSQLSKREMRYVFENGGFYLVFGDMRIPVPGGGASGCFNSDLGQRIENLEAFIEALRNIR
jgi:hypothetical protein